jgi:outer membrane protein assembly factor BamD (BamD/ComL family)
MKKILIPLLVVVLFACATTLPEIEEGLSPAEFFQRAQEASDETKYELALKYYTTFQERYPEERDRNLWAEYEIALLHYKLGQEETALELFKRLLTKYESDEAAEYTQGPRILAKKVKDRLENP